MKKITYKLWLVAMVAGVFTGVVNAQNTQKKCLEIAVALNTFGSRTNYPFINFFKQSSTKEYYDYSNQDSNGYPYSGEFFVTLFDRKKAIEMNNTELILSWDGAINSLEVPLRSISLSPWQIVPNSYKKTLVGGKCLIKLDTTLNNDISQSLRFVFLNPTPTIDKNFPQHVRNLALLRPSSALRDYDKHPFNPEFISQVNLFSTIDYRFSQFACCGDTTSSIRWSDRITPSFITQQAPYTKYTSYAYENIIELSNETKSNIALYFPICANEDYIFQMASLFKNSLKYNQSITVQPATFGLMDFFIYRDINGRLINGVKADSAEAKYMKQVWQIWKNAFGADSNRILRPITKLHNLDGTTINSLAKTYGKGSFDIIHKQTSIFSNELQVLNTNKPNQPQLTSNDVFLNMLNDIRNANAKKEELRATIALAKEYNAKVTLSFDIPSTIETSSSIYVYLTENQIEILTKTIIDTLNYMGISQAFFTMNVPTFQPNKLNEAGVREAAPYFAMVNNLPTEGDCAKPSAIESATNVQYFQVFPNPTTGEVTFTSQFFSNGEKLKIECYNSLGSAIYSGEMMLNESINMLQNQSVGIYNLIITSTEGKKYQQKIFKN